MQVKRDFERLYETTPDPWSIGDADSERYDRYRELVLGHRRGGSVLDIGTGLGAFLARFADDFDELVGVDVSPAAVRLASERYPEIEFHDIPAEALPGSILEHRRFDVIIVSDVVYYLPEAARRRLLDWTNVHLSHDGIALVAAWCPGGDYLDADEFDALVRRSLRTLHHEELTSRHSIYVTARKRRLVALTFDYETWQPIPEGSEIDWEIDVFSPTEALLDACDGVAAKITLFAELGEYLWLDEYEPELARRMEAQWQDAVRRGHDVQLHLHPSWLPETGASRTNDRWSWDATLAKADDYPGDLTELMRRCKERLESVLRPVSPGYAVTSFRAGAYQAQPFRRLGQALRDNDIFCDSSVYAGGVSSDRGYDYSVGWSHRQPYFASAWDPQLRAVPAEEQIVEAPVAVDGEGRLMLDGDGATTFADRVVSLHATEQAVTSEQRRQRRRLGTLVGMAYSASGPARRFVNLVLPKPVARLVTRYGPDRSAQHDYIVGIGHTKGDLRVREVAESAGRLLDEGFELVTMSELAHTARDELESARRSREQEAEYQVAREYDAVLGSDRNDEQSARLRRTIPLDRERVLDLGCGAGYWSRAIADAYPWMQVVGVDVGTDFIAAARERYESDRVSFEPGDFLELPFADETFDCVYADNTLEHAYDVDASLAEVWRVLENGGALVAAIPSDARNPAYVCDNHTWKTYPDDVRCRLEAAGFVDVTIDEIDVFRRLGAAPFAPSNDRLMYVRAWKRGAPATSLARAAEAMDWIYRRLEPAATVAFTAVDVIAGGQALCAGYAIALGALLEREDYDVRWLAMEASGHPRGRGERSTDSHVAIQARIEGRWHVLDAMTNTIIPYSLTELLRQPSFATEKTNIDQRYSERGYRLYDTAFWYSRVDRYRIHRSVNPHVRIWRQNRHRRPID